MTEARSKQPRRHSRSATRTPSGRRRPRSGAERIGVISDTHGLIRAEAIEALRGVDHILHAGDIGGDHVLAALRRVAPVTFVRGNNDEADGYDVVRACIGGRRVLLTHIFRDELLRERADIIVFGHSHKPLRELVEGVLLFNPGSAGPRRFNLPVCVGIIEGGRAEHIELVKRTQDSGLRHTRPLSPES